MPTRAPEWIGRSGASAGSGSGLPERATISRSSYSGLEPANRFGSGVGFGATGPGACLLQLSSSFLSSLDGLASLWVLLDNVPDDT
jgi:hypothetical protein